MTRSSSKELFTPLDNPERVFRSKRRLFETLGLVETNSPEFDLFSNIEEHSEEEATEVMTKTMEQYMSKTRGDYGSGVTRPKIDGNAHFNLKGKFLKNFAIILSASLAQEQTGRLDIPTRQILDSKAQLNSIGREIKKVNKKVYAAQVGCKLCKGPHYTQDCLLKEEGKTHKEAYYTQFGAPYQPGGQYKAAGPRFYQRNNGNSSYPDKRQTMEESLTKFMAELEKRHEENSNIIKEIRASTDAAIRNQGALIKTLEIQIGQMSKVLQERGFGSPLSSTKTNPRDHVKSIFTAKYDSIGIRRIRSAPYAISDSQFNNAFSKIVPFPRRLHDYCCDEWMEACELKILETYSIRTTLHNNTFPQKEKDPGSFTLPCFIHNVCFDKTLVNLGASVSVMPLSTYTNLGLEDLAHTRLTVELADITIKHPRGIAKNVLV
ncbi:retrovirus-related pol polyprotein from transposon TNT 1-94 [Tanacetum coccineum]